jgi:hypothetical protein
MSYLIQQFEDNDLVEDTEAETADDVFMYITETAVSLLDSYDLDSSKKEQLVARIRKRNPKDEGGWRNLLRIFNGCWNEVEIKVVPIETTKVSQSNDELYKTLMETLDKML